MKAATIFHSYSGITKGVAQKVHEAVGGEIVEVKPVDSYSKLTAYTFGCRRAMKGECDKIKPESIDVSGSDVIVIGTPVWAFKATPVVNGAVSALFGCDGKNAVIFATCGGKEGETLPILKKALEKKGVNVAGEFVFNKKDVSDSSKIDELIAAVRSAGSSE
ncbi:MAG: ArsR family transcriptional regulator [Methanomicrobiaceae archaeon]|nr:ArsR family transcriptional regulator [Methanomicrobiaceae archaeon]